jgi:hypothetical protein
MNLAIVGSRTFTNYTLLENEILKIYTIENIGCIVSGGAKGADSLAEQFAIKFNIKTKILKPDWDTYGKSAGYRRNCDIVNAADIVIAFWNGISPGTKHSIDIANKLNKKVIIINVN